MIQTLPIKQFLHQYVQKAPPLIDVRAPKEYHKGHIPGAVNLPIFDNEERGLIGTLYKQQGRDEAVLRALDIIGPKMGFLVRKLQDFTDQKQVMVHCWRGGMRSESMAWLWHMAGYNVSVLTGGYKSYRQHVQHTFGEKWQIRILSGSTGTGKTDILHSMRDQGAQIIDLEALAHHRGSAFGALGQEEQPQVEQFENNLYEALKKTDPQKPLWIEDESHAIGRIYIPLPFWQQMKKAPVYVIKLPLSLRVERLRRDYGHFPVQALADSLEKIKKRLGGNRYQEALDALKNGDVDRVVQLSLQYYDKAYSYGLEQKKGRRVYSLELSADTPANTAQVLLNLKEPQIVNS